MTSLTIYYDGHKIGLVQRWRQNGKALTLKANTLGLLSGMVIEVSQCFDPKVAATNDPVLRIGALVGQAEDSGVLIQLDELATFRN